MIAWEAEDFFELLKNNDQVTTLQIIFEPEKSVLFDESGSGSSVGRVNDYGLDGPGSNPGEDEIFRPSRPALGPTQPPVKCVLGLSQGKVRPGRDAGHSSPSSAAVIVE